MPTQRAGVLTSRSYDPNHVLVRARSTISSASVRSLLVQSMRRASRRRKTAKGLTITSCSPAASQWLKDAATRVSHAEASEATPARVQDDHLTIVRRHVGGDDDIVAAKRRCAACIRLSPGGCRPIERKLRMARVLHQEAGRRYRNREDAAVGSECLRPRIVDTRRVGGYERPHRRCVGVGT